MNKDDLYIYDIGFQQLIYGIAKYREATNIEFMVFLLFYKFMFVYSTTLIGNTCLLVCQSEVYIYMVQLCI